MSDDFSKLLAAIDEMMKADPDSGGAFTSIEAAEAWGMSQSAAYARLIEGVKKGLVQPVMAKKKTLWGRTKLTPCYKVVTPVKE